MLDDIAQVIRLEASGCGRSDPLPAYTVETCLTNLEAVRRHYGIERWIVGGHSAGADLALAYTLAYPDRVLGFICMSGGRIHNDREWHRIYSERRDQGLETLPPFDYPPNLEVNAQINRSWKAYIQRPSLLKESAHLGRPALFLYGDQDIRPSWPMEQVALDRDVERTLANSASRAPSLGTRLARTWACFPRREWQSKNTQQSITRV
jgi:proline iminopeptidase